MATFLERRVGAYPLSLGTSLALEGLLGTHPSGERPPPLGSYKQVWVNIRTLFRNLYQAVKVENLRGMTVSNASIQLLQEIQSIEQIVKDRLRKDVVFYIQSFDDCKWVYPNANFRKPKTEKQKQQVVLEGFVLRSIIDELIEHRQPYLQIKERPVVQNAGVLLLTHLPHELLWRDSFERLALLESNTGRVKPYNLWYTKLNGFGADTPFPFNAFTLQVFGDSYLFEGVASAIQKELKQLGESKRWSAITDPRKVYDDVLGYGGSDLKACYRRLMK